MNTPLSYDQAVAGLEKMVAGTPPTVREDCRPQGFLHGQATKEVFVLLHGLSNGPPQFAPFARLLFDRGHNVVVPLTPYHGEKDRMTSDWARLTAAEMLQAANEAVDLAQGLGEHVTVAGLSTNATVAGWMAQHRPDLFRCVLLAPFLAPAGAPEWAMAHAAAIATVLPNKFIWWDPKLKEALLGPENAYPRFPTRVVGQIVLFGEEILKDSQETAPRCPSILIVTTAADIAANNGITARLAANWVKHGARVTEYRFPAEEQVPHDFIDPRQPNQKTEIVYPKLLELLEA